MSLDSEPARFRAGHRCRSTALLCRRADRPRRQSDRCARSPRAQVPGVTGRRGCPACRPAARRHAAGGRGVGSRRRCGSDRARRGAAARIPLHVFLPIDADEFVRVSVADHDTEWLGLFETVMDHARDDTRSSVCRGEGGRAGGLVPAGPSRSARARHRARRRRTRRRAHGSPAGRRDTAQRHRRVRRPRRPRRPDRVDRRPATDVISPRR